MQRIELAYRNAVDVAGRLRERPGLAFLDSAAASPDLGRFSFFGSAPFGVLAVRGGVAFWNDAPLGEPPLAALKRLLARFRLPDDPDDIPFRGGCIGFVSYDFGRRLERLEAPAREVPGDELRFAFFDVALAFDHRDRRCFLYSSGLPEPDGPAREARAEARLAEIRAIVEAHPHPTPPTPAGAAVGPWRSNFPPDSYAAAVERVRAFIRAGDIYQANISQRFEADLAPGFDAFAFYRTLREANPAPFGAFLALPGGGTIASTSPERFLLCRNGAVEARPIKGTAARCEDPAADAASAARLAASEKDRAENVMIVDLLRNDLSKVCRPGTVAVPALCRLESYAAVHHLTSVVTGALRDGLDAVDLLAAAFPGGSITGAPKLRAMDIITEIEGVGRGIYCGAIGYLGFDGAMDLNVAIRTVALRPGHAAFQAGGGVTLLSDGPAEYRETLAKGSRIFAAFERFGAGEAR